MSAALIKAARAALEVLENLQGGCTDSKDGTVEAITVWCPEVVEPLRAALAAAEAQPAATLTFEQQHLLQDCDKGLTAALAGKPDAMRHAREAAAAIAAVAQPVVSRERFDRVLAQEHALSSAYVRLRQIIGAMNPPPMALADPEALWAYVESVARERLAAQPVAVPQGWRIGETGGGEIVVCAPDGDPGCMTLPNDDGGTMSVRLLRSLCRAMLAAAPAAPAPALVQLTDEQVVEGLEKHGVKFQRFMGGISGTKDCWSTAGSQDVRKLAAGIRALMECSTPVHAMQPLTAAQVMEMVFAMRYDGDDPSAKAHFINGIRAAERAHRIGGV